MGKRGMRKSLRKNNINKSFTKEKTPLQSDD